VALQAIRVAIVAANVNKVDRQQKEVEMVQRLGGSISYFNEPADENWLVARLL
jgi:hypothetical protein